MGALIFIQVHTTYKQSVYATKIQRIIIYNFTYRTEAILIHQLGCQIIHLQTTI